MVLMSVGNDDAAEFILVLEHVRVVGQNQIDTGLRVIGEHETGIDQHHVITALECGHIFTDTIQATQGNNLERRIRLLSCSHKCYKRPFLAVEVNNSGITAEHLKVSNRSGLISILPSTEPNRTHVRRPYSVCTSTKTAAPQSGRPHATLKLRRLFARKLTNVCDTSKNGLETIEQTQAVITQGFVFIHDHNIVEEAIDWFA